LQFDLWLAAGVFLSYIIKGMCGFANTLVFSSIMAFHVDNVDISPLDLVIGIPANLCQFWRNRRNIRKKEALLLASLVIAGIIPGALLLKSGDTHGIKLLFGGVVVALGLEMLVGEIRGCAPKKPHPAALLAVGIAAGLMVGLFGIGALLAVYVGRTAANSAEFKGTLAVVFLVDNATRLTLYTATGILNAQVLRLAVLCLPLMLAGLLLGMWLARYVNEHRAKLLVDGFLVLSGVSLLATNLARLIR
jgi:uncharacterized membrane protein YfcA